MKKRLLSLALALCLVCSLLPGTALAAGENPFTDVPASHWAHDDITYVYENDLMNGTDGSLFSPESTTTRAQVVTVLYRLAGQPAADWENPFWDVPASAWFHDAVTWAWENDITGGVSSTHFGAGNAVTREQLAAFLYRYAQDQGYDTSAQADLSGYSDAGLVSSYATEALSWANATGLITGTTATTLNPNGTCTIEQAVIVAERSVYAHQIGWYQAAPVTNVYSYNGSTGEIEREDGEYTSFDSTNASLHPGDLVWITGKLTGVSNLLATAPGTTVDQCVYSAYLPGINPYTGQIMYLHYRDLIPVRG